MEAVLPEMAYGESGEPAPSDSLAPARADCVVWSEIARVKFHRRSWARARRHDFAARYSPRSIFAAPRTEIYRALEKFLGAYYYWASARFFVRGTFFGRLLEMLLFGTSNFTLRSVH